MDQARDVKAGERKTLAKKGQANPDGSFPIKTKGDLRNAIAAFGRSKNKAKTKALIIRRAKALGATNLLPEGWMTTKTDKAHAGMIECPETDCERAFVDEARLLDHAEAVHTFGDIQRAVNDAVRERYRVEGDPRVGIKSVWAWVVDVAEDWVVFEIENGSDVSLQKATYTFNDGVVTLGDPVEVQRKTVYEPVKKSES